MKRKYIRWLFLAAFVVFAVIMKESRLLSSRPGMFIILWLLASYAAVFGIFHFRDKDAVIEADSISAEETRIKIGLE